jgi:8-amino-7-oxononanoate synthase
VTSNLYLSRYQLALDDLAAKGRLRALRPRVGMDFTSNDYLALAACTRLQNALRAALERGVPVGAGGSRLLRGNAEQHEQLESEAADFFRCERALFFGSGYAANQATFATLPQRDDLLLLDDLVHASVHDGARSGRAQALRVPHNDVDAFEHQIAAWRARGGHGQVWIAVESLYSMDGDRAPLQELMALADRHQAMLCIDEAHATGVYGPQGRGLATPFEGRDNVLTLHTCSKALGAAGALLCAPRTLCDFMVNRCRPFIYATAPSPLMAVAGQEALRILREEPQRQQRLQQLIAFAHQTAAQHDIATRGASQIIPIIVGADSAAVALAATLTHAGFDIRAIRPPTVPEGTARLRISITLHVDEHAIEQVFAFVARESQRSATP